MGACPRPGAGMTGVPAVAAEGSAALLLRPARPDDVAAIVAIEVASFSDPWSASSFLALIGETRVDFRVAERTGTVLGYVLLWRAADESELANLAVARTHRGAGVGSALLDEVLARAGESGVRSTYLEVRESNTAARALYASRGFREMRRRRQYYRKPVEDALVMVRAMEGSGPG